MKRTLLAVALSLATMTAPPAEAKEAHEAKLKRPICEETYILHLGARLGQYEGNRFVEDDPKEAGSAVYYANGKYGVSYDYVPELSERAKEGDKVQLCLVAKYVDCPKGDDRGKTYRATDLRTGGTWTLMDSEHICGGA